MKYIKYFEFVQNDFEPIKSFHLKDELNPKVWDGEKMKSEIREQLLTISQDFYNSTDLDASIKDVILTGSLSNYNWSEKYSDYDLHILIDFKDVNEDEELVKKFVDAVKNLWNKQYDITIEGYEVEVYIQDVKEIHKSSGVYSVLNDRWSVKPTKADFEPDELKIREKAKTVMMLVDDLEEEVDKDDHDEFVKKVKKVWDKIKRYRKSGLESEGGEFSTGNLVFKLLRRNGYIGKILDMRKESYQNQFD